MESPTPIPRATRKVKAIPPPMSSTSTLSISRSMTPNLSETLLPPRIATKGFSGFATMSVSVSTSRASRSPAYAGRNSATPAVDAWARWAASEGVVDVYVAQAGQCAGELGIVGLLARVEAHVLEHEDLAVDHPLHGFLSLGTHRVGREGDVSADEPLQARAEPA